MQVKEVKAKTHLCSSSSMHSIKELLQVSALKGWCSLRAGQDGHEMGNSFLKVASFPEATPQCVMNVLLNEAPVLSLVHAQRLPALAADLRSWSRRAQQSAAAKWVCERAHAAGSTSHQSFASIRYDPMKTEAGCWFHNLPSLC